MVCSGFLYVLEIGVNFICLGKYKKVIIVGVDKMLFVIDYIDCVICFIFVDGVVVFLLEFIIDYLGVIDFVLRIDGKGFFFLYMKVGGLVCLFFYFIVDNYMYYFY